MTAPVVRPTPPVEPHRNVAEQLACDRSGGGHSVSRSIASIPTCVPCASKGGSGVGEGREGVPSDLVDFALRLTIIDALYSGTDQSVRWHET